MNKPNPNATEANATEVALKDDAEARAELVARYLRGELCASENEAFEIALIDDAELFAEVQLQHCLVQALAAESTAPLVESQDTAALVAQTANALPIHQSSPTHGGRQSAVFSRPRAYAWSGWAYARAAGVAVLALGLLVQSVRLHSTLSELAQYQQPRVGIPVLTIYEERGAPPEREYVVEYTAGQREVMVEIESLEPAFVKIIIAPRLSTLLFDKVVSPNVNGYIQISLPTKNDSLNYFVSLQNDTSNTRTYSIFLKLRA